MTNLIEKYIHVLSVTEGQSQRKSQTDSESVNIVDDGKTVLIQVNLNSYPLEENNSHAIKALALTVAIS